MKPSKIRVMILLLYTYITNLVINAQSIDNTFNESAFNVDQEIKTPTPNPEKGSASMKTELSSTEIEVIQLKEKLKKLNDDIKKIIPNADTQIKESQKRRAEKQKKAQQATQSKRGGGGSGGSYFPSYHGGQGSSGYRPYSPSGPTYTGGSYGGYSYPGASSGSSYPGFDSTPATWKDSSMSDKKDESLKSTKPENYDSEQKSKNKHSGDDGYSKLQKDQKQAVDKVNGITQSIKANLKRILDSIEITSSEVSEDKKQDARNNIYSNLLEDNEIEELSNDLRQREKTIQGIPADKQKSMVPIDKEEKRLWGKFLPHLMQLFIYVTDDGGIPDLRTYKTLLKRLRPQYLSTIEVKNEQSKIEQILASKLQKELNDNSGAMNDKMKIFIQQANKLPMQKQNQALLKVINQVKNINSQQAPEP